MERTGTSSLCIWLCAGRGKEDLIMSPRSCGPPPRAPILAAVRCCAVDCNTAARANSDSQIGTEKMQPKRHFTTFNSAWASDVEEEILPIGLPCSGEPVFSLLQDLSKEHHHRRAVSQQVEKGRMLADNPKLCLTSKLRVEGLIPVAIKSAGPPIKHN